MRLFMMCCSAQGLQVSSWTKQWATKLPGSKEPAGNKNWYEKGKWATKRDQLFDKSTVLRLQKCIRALQYLFCSSKKFSLWTLGKKGSQIWLSFARNSPGKFCPHVCSYTNNNLSWAAGASSEEFPFKETHKPLAVTSRCDSAVYLILIKSLTGVFWFCFAGRNHSYFQLCMLPLYLVVGT